MRAVRLLTFWKLKNALRTVFSDPRKYVPITIAILWVGLTFGMLSVATNQAPKQALHGSVDTDLFGSAVLVGLILLGLSVIDSGLGDGLLAFGMSDVDYLFPSPISRRIVLAYRLPALMVGVLFSAGFLLFGFSTITRLIQLKTMPGHATSPGWVPPVSLALSVGIYMNLAMFVSLRINDRRKLHKGLLAIIVLFCGSLGLIYWLRGVHALEAFVGSAPIRWIFFPSSLAADSLLASYSAHTTAHPIAWLLTGFLVTLVPMFTTNSNWYEQSIVSTERMTAFRQAAKGGYASLMASKASTFRHKGAKTYTVSPFGQGAVALFWAHLCAAAKKPLLNFVTPLLAGVGTGAFSSFVNSQAMGVGYGVLIAIAAYCSMGFLGIAKTASEAAIRRRELISPLPISGWQTTAANLGVPFLSALLYFIGAVLAYGLAGGPTLAQVAFALIVMMPLRTAARMTLQYIVVIAYPDIADKIQQVLAVGVYAVCTMPFLVAEVLLCLPAAYFGSVWLALIALAVFQIPLIALMLMLAGKATERAIATGEPVTIRGLISSSPIAER